MLEVLACREIAKNHPVDQLKVTLNFVSKSPNSSYRTACNLDNLGSMLMLGSTQIRVGATASLCAR